jgi:hypothetical protein
MAGLPPIVWLVLFSALGIGTIVYLTQMARLLNYVEVTHSDLYESLGRPSLFLNNTPRNGFLVLGWLWREDYLDVQDPELMRRAGLVRRLLILISVSFIALVVLFPVTLVISDLLAT